MGRSAPKLDKDRVIYLYDKFGTMTRTALSLGVFNWNIEKFLNRESDTNKTI